MADSQRSEKRSLKDLVGVQTYAVWVDVLRLLVPDGRTHRLSTVVASMLQYASQVAFEKFGEKPDEGSVADSLLMASELDDSKEIERDLSDLVERLFDDAGVRYRRKNRRGDDYSIVDSSIEEFINWDNMPWE